MTLGNKLINDGQRMGQKMGENMHNMGSKMKSHMKISQPYFIQPFMNMYNAPKKSPLEK